jgi:hypothetical protein
MRIFTFRHYTLSISGAAALLIGCGGLQVPTTARDTSATTPSFKHDRFFTYTGGKQSFKVPAAVTHLTITAYGANGAWGGAGYSQYASSGGSGATVTATIPVTPGERLAVFVGGNGGHDGFNGGGALRSHSRCDCNSQGGGASDVRQGGDLLADRVVVAGGGGGGASNGSYGSYSTDGGSGGYGGREGGGGSNGSNELYGSGGAGGTRSAGGKGGVGGAVYGGSSCNGSDGALGVGGAGGAGYGSGCGGAGGGGGGGYYGGGGGGAGGSDLTSSGSGPRGAGGGGGGGSSFAERRAKHVAMSNGGNPTKHGDGSILVFW